MSTDGEEAYEPLIENHDTFIFVILDVCAFYLNRIIYKLNESNIFISLELLIYFSHSRQLFVL